MSAAFPAHGILFEGFQCLNDCSDCIGVQICICLGMYDCWNINNTMWRIHVDSAWTPTYAYTHMYGWIHSITL